ncbi:MAG: protein kinase [Planctomycetales bacterium]|nr:protein kinase [Planctomycetales bacterium]
MHNDPNTKPQLEGYELIDKLGAGGYGEVWSARVPGGLTKAVKIIYGRQDDQRAANELKSLERIREVRHPFVVSLERIEFVGGRLLVVSELADGSLRDRFVQCVEQGLPGIPREELLGYLRDTADALDYLTERHQLQHLDIKPENLLLLAGHAKVADFGLVKAVGDKTQSIVGGMTPAYAPPEVFQGNPSRQSDQYSLAVLYQELLTGELPFDGQNVAELTLQHLHDDPNLLSLGENDHFAVSRALSKSPEHRYESCTEFVRALQGAGGFAASGAVPRNLTALRPTPAERVTEVFDDDSPTRVDGELKLDLPPLEHDGSRRLPPPVLDALDFDPSPALFIGVGGTAGVVLKELRQKISERYELTAPLGVMPMLLMDSDTRSLMAAGRNAGKGAGLTAEETIALPLRRPQEYRERSGELLRWLSRRWLYNIPKSLQTEGIRPLGRLALVDHARQAFQRLRRTIMDCVSPESLREAEANTGVTFRADALRVYLVTSAAGGAGSGMTFDVAYAVRSLLQRMGIKHTRVIGVVTTSSSRHAERGELARVNTYSWISEHQHFHAPSSVYPGDQSCGLPAHKAGVRPFDSTYLVSLGARLDDNEFAESASRVADYLFTDATTPAQVFLDACRDQHGEEDPRRSLRTFSVTRKEAAPADSRRAAEQLLINQLVDAWRFEHKSRQSGQVQSGSTSRVVHGAGEVVGRLKLDPASVATNCRGLIEAHLQSLGIESPSATGAVQRLGELNAHFADPLGGVAPLLGDDTPTAVCGQAVSRLVAPYAEKLATEVANWVLAVTEKPGDRLAGALQAVEWFRNHSEALLKDFTRFADATKGKIGQVVQAASASEGGNEEIERRFVRLKVDLAAMEGAAQVAAALRASLERIAEELVATRPAIDQLQKSLGGEVSGTLEAVYDLFASIDVKPGALPTLLDKRLQEDWIGPRGGLLEVLSQRELLDELTGMVRRVAQQLVRELFLMDESGQTAGWKEEDWRTPPLANLGEGWRRCAVTPAGAGTPQLAVTAEHAQVTAAGSDTYLITECDGLSAPHVAAALVGQRRDYAEFAERVHTRRDIEWNDLLTPSTTAAERDLPVNTIITPVEFGSPKTPSDVTPQGVQFEVLP